MIFKAIQDRFKVKSGKKFLEDELNRKRIYPKKLGVSQVACIVDMDAFENTDVFKTLRKTLDLPPNGVHIIGFKRADDKNGIFEMPVVTEKQLGWNGSIENTDFEVFAGREYDLLLNYYNDNRLMLKLMSAKINARVRVGLLGADQDFSDLIFDCHINDFRTFNEEMLKYLKILKEIA